MPSINLEIPNSLFDSLQAINSAPASKKFHQGK